jgi:phosphatidate cytidylyltransferase
MSALAARVRTGATLAAIAAVLLWLSARFPPGSVSLAIVSVLALVAVWELDNMGRLRAVGLGRPLYRAALASSIALGLAFAREPEVPPLLGLLALYAIAAVFAWPFGTSGAGAGATRARLAVVLLAAWLLPPLFAIVLLDRVHGTAGLVVLVLLAKIGDNAGFFVGRAFGKRRPFPRVSPGKTVAGCVASLVAGIVAGAGLLPFTLGERTLGHAALGGVLGGIVNVAAQAGDLSESWVKRRAEVKDSSVLLGPSGGFLDALDSLLLATPVALVAWTLAYGP